MDGLESRIKREINPYFLKSFEEEIGPEIEEVTPGDIFLQFPT